MIFNMKYLEYARITVSHLPGFDTCEYVVRSSLLMDAAFFSNNLRFRFRVRYFEFTLSMHVAQNLERRV